MTGENAKANSLDEVMESLFGSSEKSTKSSADRMAISVGMTDDGRKVGLHVALSDRVTGFSMTPLRARLLAANLTRMAEQVEVITERAEQAAAKQEAKDASQ